jgi:sodium/proline symporter
LAPVAVGFIVYLLIILVVGVVTARLTKTLPDFLLAGRRLGPWVVAFSERASGESGWMLLGLTGLAYATGLGDPSGKKPEPAMWTALGGVLGIAASWYLVAGRLRADSGRLGALTLPRYLELRYRDSDAAIRLVATTIITFCFAFYVAAQFDAAGKSLEQTFGWNHLTGVLVGAAVIVFYTLMGGFLAVAWTDFIQGWIMLITLVVLPLATLVLLGGPSGLARSVGEINPMLLTASGGRTGWSLAAGILGGFGVGLGYAGQPHLLVRYMSIRSTEDIPASRRIAIVWALLAYAGAVLMGLVALAWFGADHFADAEMMMPELALSIFPGWFAGILICGALAAMMSTADSQLLVTTSAIAEDIYHQNINPGASQGRLVMISRLVTLLVGVAAIFLSRLPKSIFDKVLFAWAGLGAAFGPALILSLWWSGTTRNGVLAGMITGFLSVIVWENSPYAGVIYSLVPAFTVAFISVIVVSMAERKPGGHPKGR